MYTLLKIGETGFVRKRTDPHLFGLLYGVIGVFIFMHLSSHSIVVMAVERYVVIPRDYELELSINLAETVDCGTVLLKSSIHGKVAAVEKHIGSRKVYVVERLIVGVGNDEKASLGLHFGGQGFTLDAGS